MKAPNLGDLQAAIAARLSGIPLQVAQMAAQAIFCGEGAQANENAAAVILDKAGVVAEGNVETLFRALLAKGAEAAGDWHAYYPAAFIVWQARQQSERARGARGGDALDGLIRQLLDDHPKFSRPYLWAEIARQAKEGGEILADYDPFADLVSFQPRPHADLQDIGYVAFCRRVSRIKKSSGREPACVPPDLEDANTPPRLAA